RDLAPHAGWGFVRSPDNDPDPPPEVKVIRQEDFGPPLVPVDAPTYLVGAEAAAFVVTVSFERRSPVASSPGSDSTGRRQTHYARAADPLVKPPVSVPRPNPHPIH